MKRLRSIWVYGYNDDGIYCVQCVIYIHKNSNMTPRRAKKHMLREYGATQFSRVNRWQEL